MNVCIDIIKHEEKSCRVQSQQTERSCMAKKQAMDFQFLVNSPRKQKGKNLKNAWNKTQRKRYISFLKKNVHLFSLTLQERKFKKINVLMSEAIKTRSPAKCHSFHQKMMVRHGTIESIIQQNSDLFEKRLSVETMPENESDLPVSEVHSEEIIADEEENVEPFWMRYLDLVHFDSDPMWEQLEYQSQ